MKKRELIEARAEVAAQIEGIMDSVEGNDYTAEQTETLNTLMDQSAQLKKTLDLLAHNEEVKSDLQAISAAAKSDGIQVVTGEDYDLAFSAFAKLTSSSDSGLHNDVSNQERSALERCGYDADVVARGNGSFSFPIMSRSEVKAAYDKAVMNQSRNVGTEGGLFISESMSTNLEVALLAYGGTLAVADTIVTNNANPLSWPTFDDTANKGRQIGEAKTVGNAASLKFGKQTWGAFKFTSDALKISHESLRDIPNLTARIGEAFGVRLGRILNEKMTVGGGGVTCEGILTGSLDSGVTQSIATWDWVSLIELEHSIEYAIRNRAGAYMMHDQVAKQYRLLKDADGRPMWQDSLQVGEPDRLHGRPVVINHEMPDGTTVGDKAVLFGDMSAFKVRRVGAIRSYRLSELYRESDQEGFVAFVEADSGVLNPYLSATEGPLKFLKTVS